MEVLDLQHLNSSYSKTEGLVLTMFFGTYQPASKGGRRTGTGRLDDFADEETTR
jgi:hypothetical protein